MQGVQLRTSPLNYLFMHTGEAGAYCLGVFDNGASGTLLGGISFRNILVQVRPGGGRSVRAPRLRVSPVPCAALLPNGSLQWWCCS